MNLPGWAAAPQGVELTRQAGPRLPAAHGPFLHQGGPVTALQFLQPVGDPQGRKRRLRLVAEAPHQIQHGLLAGWIEQGRGLIEQHQAGAAGQGTGNGQPLFLAAAEGVDRPRPKALQANLGQGQSDPFAALLAAEVGG